MGSCPGYEASQRLPDGIADNTGRHRVEQYHHLCNTYEDGSFIGSLLLDPSCGHLNMCVAVHQRHPILVPESDAVASSRYASQSSSHAFGAMRLPFGSDHFRTGRIFVRIIRLDCAIYEPVVPSQAFGLAISSAWWAVLRKPVAESVRVPLLQQMLSRLSFLELRRM